MFITTDLFFFSKKQVLRPLLLFPTKAFNWHHFNTPMAQIHRLFTRMQIFVLNVHSRKMCVSISLIDHDFPSRQNISRHACTFSIIALFRHWCANHGHAALTLAYVKQLHEIEILLRGTLGKHKTAAYMFYEIGSRALATMLINMHARQQFAAKPVSNFIKVLSRKNCLTNFFAKQKLSGAPATTRPTYCNSDW